MGVKIIDHSIIKQNIIFRLLVVYGVMLIGIGFLADSFSDIYIGLTKIVLSPSNLVSDYIQIGGIGSAFVNSGVLTLFSLLILRKYQYSVTSLTISVIMMLSGFSFFGKNVMNSLPIILGALLFIKITHSEHQDNIVVGLLGTCLSPLVSIIFLNNSLLYKVLSFFVGILIGFIIVPIFNYLTNHTKGLNLYNMGFSAGIIGMFGNLLTRKILQIQIVPHLFQTTYSKDLVVILSILFSIVLSASVYGLLTTQDFFIEKGVLHCIQKNKFFSLFEIVKLLKFSIYGFFSLFIITTLEVPLSGPVVGTIITFAGFSMYDFGFMHYFFPASGAMLVSYFIFNDVTSTTNIVIIFFASTLSPYTRSSGFIAGFFAGGIFSVISRKIGILHAGINLYNSGFAGGITVILFYLLDTIYRNKFSANRLISLFTEIENMINGMKERSREEFKKVILCKIQINQFVDKDGIDI